MLLVIVTAVVIDDDVIRKFICRVGDDCGEGVVDDDDGDDVDIYLRMRQTLYTVFVVFDDHHDIEGKN